jgi:hypothetical protein
MSVRVFLDQHYARELQRFESAVEYSDESFFKWASEVAIICKGAEDKAASGDPQFYWDALRLLDLMALTLELVSVSPGENFVERKNRILDAAMYIGKQQRSVLFKFYGFTEAEFPSDKTAPGLFGDLVYLRSLKSSRRFMIANAFGGNRPDIFSYPREPVQMSLEAAIQRAFMRNFWNAAIGGPYDPFGMSRCGKIGSRDWQKTIVTAARVADVMFFLPAETAGVLWEAELLLTGRTKAKLVFVMLPQDIEPEAESAWNRLKDLAHSKSLEMPAYSSQGGYFIVSAMDFKSGNLMPFHSLFDGSLFLAVAQGLIPVKQRKDHIQFLDALGATMSFFDGDSVHMLVPTQSPEQFRHGDAVSQPTARRALSRLWSGIKSLGNS